MELIKSRATVCAILLTMLFLLSHDGGGTAMVAEARVCMDKSHHHSFPCLSDRMCSRECVNEKGGWTAGYCHLRYCRCQKAC